MVGLETRRRKVALGGPVDVERGEAVGVQVAAQRRQDVLGVDADDEAQLAVGPRPRRDRVDRAGRIAGLEGEDLEGAPPVDALGRGEAGLAPIGVDRRAFGAAVDRQRGQRLAHRRRERGGPPFGHADRAARVGDRGERMREHDAGVGDQPTPIARMVAALPQVGHQVEVQRAARAEEQRRAAGADPRPVGGDEHVCGEPVAVRVAHRVQPGRADLLAGLDQPLEVDAEAGTRGIVRGEALLARPPLQHQPQRGEIDRMLALVVGGAATVPAVALGLQRPRIAPVPPVPSLATDHVPVPVAQHRRARCVLDAAREQHRPARGGRVRNRLALEAQGVQRRPDLVTQVGGEHRRARGLLALGGHGDPPGERLEEAAGVEPAVGIGKHGAPGGGCPGDRGDWEGVRSGHRSGTRIIRR